MDEDSSLTSNLAAPGTVRRQKTQDAAIILKPVTFLEGVPKSNIIFTMVSFWHLSEALKSHKAYLCGCYLYFYKFLFDYKGRKIILL